MALGLTELLVSTNADGALVVMLMMKRTMFRNAFSCKNAIYFEVFFFRSKSNQIRVKFQTKNQNDQFDFGESKSIENLLIPTSI